MGGRSQDGQWVGSGRAVSDVPTTCEYPVNVTAPLTLAAWRRLQVADAH